MIEIQHHRINRRLKVKKALSMLFVLVGVGLIAVVLLPLFYTVDTATTVATSTESPTSSDSDTQVVAKAQPTAVMENLSYQDNEQQATITADKAEQSVEYTRLQSAQIASDANKTLLQADTATIDNATKEVDAEGNVYYRDKDGVEISSQRMKVKQNEHVKATGGVVISGEGVIVKSESATYKEKDGVITMTGGVTIEIDE